MRALFCGDRNWTDRKMIATRLSEMNVKFPDLQICHGAARGADTIAGEEAILLGIPVTAFVADWARYGRAAGPVRNRRMLSEFKPDVVEAFHDDIEKSKGTRDMVKIARSKGIIVVVNHHLTIGIDKIHV